MRTRSSSNLPVVSPPNPSSSNTKRRNCIRSKQPFILEESPIVTMADQRTMAELLRGNLLERRTQDVLMIIENKSKIAKLTHAVNQQMSVVTIAMTAILKQFQATPPPASIKSVEEICVTYGGAHPYYQYLAADGNTFPELRDNIQGYVSAAAVNYNQGSGSLSSNTISNPKGKLKAITTRSGIVLDGPTVPTPPPFINPEEDERVEETLTNLDLSEYTFKVPPPPVQKYKPLDVFVSVGKFTFPADFVIVDYESDPRVPLILEKPFLQTARALIDVHGEEMILRDGDKRLTLNMRHDTSSYSNQPQKESINLINVFNNSSKDFLEDLFSNQSSGNPTFSSHPELTSPEVQNDIFDLEGSNVLPEKLVDLDYTKDLHPPLHVNPLSGSTTYSSSLMLEELADKLALITFPPKYYDDLQFDVEENVYDDPFNSKGEKIKESKLLIDELDLPCDFLPSEYDSFIFEDFSRVDVKPSTNNEDKVFNPSILSQENPFEFITRVVQYKKLAIFNASLVLEDFDPPLYEPLFFNEVPRGTRQEMKSQDDLIEGQDK
nr:reverse transcriptase domain-containing protein [Tanacetum cinerariifolium]